MKDTPNTVVMISIGTRPWADSCFETFSRYGTRYKLDVHRIDSIPSKDEFPFPDLPDKPGRSHKACYALKTYAAWRFMDRGYRRVLVIDDTCAVHPGAPNIFDAVPTGYLGFTRTSAKHARKSFEVIQAFQASHGEDSIPLDEEKYANTGVVLYSVEHKDAISPEKIVSASDLMFAAYPHQTLLYYLAMTGGIKMYEIDKRFNRLPGGWMGRDERRNLESADALFHRGTPYISHVTGAYARRDRLTVNIARKFLDAWDAELPVGRDERD